MKTKDIMNILMNSNTLVDTNGNSSFKVDINTPQNAVNPVQADYDKRVKEYNIQQQQELLNRNNILQNQSAALDIEYKKALLKTEALRQQNIVNPSISNTGSTTSTSPITTTSGSTTNTNSTTNNSTTNNTATNTKRNNGSPDTLKIRSYLKSIEGDKMEWLPTEKSATLPYGVYIHYNQNAKPVKVASSIFKKYGLNINNKADVKRSNKIISKDDMEVIKNESAKYIYNKFTNKKLFKHMSSAERLTYFNIALNSGKSTADRYMAEALGTSKKNLYNAIKHKKTDTSDFLIQRQRKHYNYIISKHPEKQVFARGWNNRMNNLARDKNRYSFV